MVLTSSGIFRLKPRWAAVIIVGLVFAILGWSVVPSDNLLSNSVLAEDPPGVGGKSAAISRSLPDFVGLVKRIGPSVVNISTTQASRPGLGMPGPFGGDHPFNEFWERFFGGQIPRGPQRQRGLGSGFIIDPEGIIVTNHHVVDGAEKIVVRLSDGKDFDAKVLGSDEKTDIAILKIDGVRGLTPAMLGDSDRLEVGEWVMAIGNPFGLDSTVTTGIVSAKGRHIGAGPYDSFIQTDASINPGNSGGPLVNLRGEVIGINTAIFSQSGGNIGIGFAIPSNLARDLIPQLRDKGRVVRGYLGVTIQKVTDDIAATMGLQDARGALVAEVAAGGPAERSGIRTGDIIVQFNGNDIKDSADLPLEVARVAPGESVQVKILRDLKATNIVVKIGEMKDEEVLAESSQGDFGMTVQPVTPALAESLGLEKPEGLLVSAIKPGSSAAEAGLRRGDVIMQINRRPVRDLADFKREISQSENGKSILFLIKRDKRSLFLALKR